MISESTVLSCVETLKGESGLLCFIQLLPAIILVREAFIFFKDLCCCFQSLGRVQLFVTTWTTARQASLSFSISWSFLKLMFESVVPSNHLILCHPLPLLPSICPSIRVFSNESVLCIRWPKYWSFSISPSNEYSGLISFRIDWFNLLAVQGTLKSLFQLYSLKASILHAQPFLLFSSHICT